MRLTLALGAQDLRANAVLLGFFVVAGIIAPALAVSAHVVVTLAAEWIFITFGITTIPVMAGFWCVGAEKMSGSMRVLAGLAVSRSAVVCAKHLEAVWLCGGFIVAGAAVFLMLHVDGPATSTMLLALALPAAIAAGAVATTLSFVCPPQTALVIVMVGSLCAAWPVGNLLVTHYVRDPLATALAAWFASGVLTLAGIVLSSMIWGSRDDVCR
jgi:ABC-type transport system involved in multi-copper enzyme maturation permease subunit